MRAMARMAVEKPVKGMPPPIHLDKGFLQLVLICQSAHF
jgi:hypothetical protein